MADQTENPCRFRQSTGGRLIFVAMENATPHNTFMDSAADNTFKIAIYFDGIGWGDMLGGKRYATEAQAKFAARKLRLGDEAIDWKVYAAA